MSQTKTVSMSKDFTPFPEGRTTKDGPYSAERFRIELLIPALQTNEFVTVDLTETLGISVAFLDEAFGGLVTKEGYSEMALKKRLTIRGDVPSDSAICWEKINKAKA